MPGVTGAVDCQIDQLNRLLCAPNPLADAGRKQMFANIHRLAGRSIGNLLVQMPGALGRVQEMLSSENSFSDVFQRLDNGDGKVTFGDIFSYNQDKTGALADLLPAIKREMHIGMAHENEQTIATLGVTRGMLQSESASDQPVLTRLSITDGTSNTIVFAGNHRHNYRRFNWQLSGTAAFARRTTIRLVSSSRISSEADLSFRCSNQLTPAPSAGPAPSPLPIMMETELSQS